ncbi:MAG: hypothetical protein ACHQYQ_07535 [Bacteriovoracales bacterium]
MDWLIFIFLFPIAFSNDTGIFPDSIFDQIPSKEVLWELDQKQKSFFGTKYNSKMGPFPRKSEEMLPLISPDLLKINFTDEVYLDTDPAIPPKWMSEVGEVYGFPFALELGAFFRINNFSFKADFLGYFNQYVGFPGREYAWRAQLQFNLPD